jgi:hypothetical protein
MREGVDDDEIDNACSRPTHLLTFHLSSGAGGIKSQSSQNHTGPREQPPPGLSLRGSSSLLRARPVRRLASKRSGTPSRLRRRRRRPAAACTRSVGLLNILRQAHGAWRAPAPPPRGPGRLSAPAESAARALAAAARAPASLKIRGPDPRLPSPPRASFVIHTVPWALISRPPPLPPCAPPLPPQNIDRQFAALPLASLRQTTTSNMSGKGERIFQHRAAPPARLGGRPPPPPLKRSSPRPPSPPTSQALRASPARAPRARSASKAPATRRSRSRVPRAPGSSSRSAVSTACSRAARPPTGASARPRPSIRPRSSSTSPPRCSSSRVTRPRTSR